jgi:hypothetical protein
MMILPVVQTGARKGREWRCRLNFFQISSKKLCLPTGTLRVNKLPFFRKTDHFELGISFAAVAHYSLEEAESVRSELLREKMQLENRLQNLNESGIFSHETNPNRHPGLLEKKIVDLKSELAEKQDAAGAAIEKMRRAEMIAAEAQKEIATERQSIVQLHKDKVGPLSLFLTVGSA